jgi:uncharacterized protein involved in exopolysaccharide biosynthesis
MVVFGLALVAASMMSQKYKAVAEVLVEAPQIPSELARSSVAIGTMEQMQILQQRILTRENLLALADRYDLYAGSEVKPADEDIVGDLRSKISFEELIQDSSVRSLGTTILQVSVTGRDPALAARIANEIAGMLVARNQQQRTDRAGNTLQFFNQEVARLGSELSRVEAEILKFKTDNKDTLPDSIDFRRTQQSSLQERIVSLEREEAELRSRRSGLIATYTNTGRLSDATPLTPEQQMLADLNRALAEQLSIFSDTSPSVASLRSRIAALQRKELGRQPKQAALREKKERDATEAASFGLDLQLSDIDERLEAIGRERVTTNQRIEQLTRSIAATPASETVLNALERNHANIQTQYNAAIARRADASTGEQIEMRSDGGRLTLIEAALPPRDPANLSRARIVRLMGAPAGLAFGLGLVVLLEMFNRTIRRPSDVERLLQVQPLAVIPEIRTKDQKPGKRRGFAFTVIAVGAVPVGLLFQQVEPPGAAEAAAKPWAMGISLSTTPAGNFSRALPIRIGR